MRRWCQANKRPGFHERVRVTAAAAAASIYVAHTHLLRMHQLSSANAQCLVCNHHRMQWRLPKVRLSIGAAERVHIVHTNVNVRPAGNKARHTTVNTHNELYMARSVGALHCCKAGQRELCAHCTPTHTFVPMLCSRAESLMYRAGDCGRLEPVEWALKWMVAESIYNDGHVVYLQWLRAVVLMAQRLLV